MRFSFLGLGLLAAAAACRPNTTRPAFSPVPEAAGTEVRLTLTTHDTGGLTDADHAMAKQIDAYLLVPDNYDSGDAKFEFLSRKAGDFVAADLVESSLNDAVRAQRLAAANINEATRAGSDSGR